MKAGTDVPTVPASGTSHRSRLFYFNAGFFTQSRVRRILDLAGYDLTLGKPGADDQIAVWGKSPTAPRGQAVGDLTGASLVHVEDAYLRSILPGRSGEPPLGLTVDHSRPYFDSSGPSDLETLLSETPFDDAAHLARARRNMARIAELQLSKYNDANTALPPPEPGYVLVIDQTRDDAAITYGGGSVASFREMLVYAQQDHPGARILIKSHPETAHGHREGHFGPEHLSDRMQLVTEPYSPQALFEGAIAVYTVSSLMGFEAIMAGHAPQVFGQPFYAGWGLTHDHQPIDRRRRKLTRAQLFAGAMMDYPLWYDPYRDALCELENLLDTLETLTRAHRADRQGYAALGMSSWKHPHLNAFFGQGKPLEFLRNEAEAAKSDRPTLVWASKLTDTLRARATAPLIRVEDGFLRSRGLGADLIAPLSLVTDETGIYYDPSGPSDLEDLIAMSDQLSDDALHRARDLRLALTSMGLSKYNQPGETPDIEADGREVILVAGQVEDDASILKGAPGPSTNAELIAAVRRDFPEAYLIFKPHPDVEAGLRKGATPEDADLLASHADPIALLGRCDRVATLTSLLGFEALIRNIPVTCYGLPFYAGWGLTDDRLPTPPRRRARPSIDGLVHAALIAYPRYLDPVTGLACPPEVIVERLGTGNMPAPAPTNRVRAKLQALLMPFAGLWRKG